MEHTVDDSYIDFLISKPLRFYNITSVSNIFEENRYLFI